jgi:hypothetical protein
MEKLLLLITVIMVIVFSCVGINYVEVEREYDLYQLNKESEEVVSERLLGFLVFVTAKSESSREQRLNFYYRLEAGEVKEKILDEIDVDKISYFFIEDGEQPRLEVLIKSSELRDSQIQEYKDEIELYKVNDYNISQIKFYIPEGTIAKYYKVE